MGVQRCFEEIGVRKRWILLVLVCLAVAGAVWWWYHQQSEVVQVKPAELHLDKVEKTHRIVVFVHGTFGSTLGFLDVPSVMRDNLKGSFYTKTARSMRKDQFFFCTQPLLQRGLVGFEPSLQRSSDDGGFAVYPIGKCFEHMAQRTWGDGEMRHYYVFGWSGLLSQSKRRQEAVRLLNELNEEIKKFNARGITPKITLVSHSHGGNVILNMGLLVAELEGFAYPEIPGLVDPIIQQKLRAFLQELPEREAVQSLTTKKRWDYRPEKPWWKPEQVVFLGTPIQPETDFGILSPLFTSVFNCYSYADRVQPHDWVSTSRYYSEQRFDRVLNLFKTHNFTFPADLAQMRLMFGRAVTDDGSLVYVVDGVHHKKRRSVWNLLVGDLAPATVHADPTHKELWFVVSPKQDETIFLKPLPVAILTPLLFGIHRKEDGRSDYDCNLAVRGDDVCIELAEHQKGIILERVSVPHAEIKTLQASVRNWEVSEEFLEKEENMLSSHVQMGRL